MGKTYAKSFLNAHIVTKENMLILERSEEKAEALSKLDIGTVHGTPGDYIKEADLIVLAVKPQDVNLLFDSIEAYIDKQQVFLSIMAGISIETISKYLGAPKIIRAMPNLPAQIGKGMTVFTSSPDVTRIELVTVQNLVNATGKSLWISMVASRGGTTEAAVSTFDKTLVNKDIKQGMEAALNRAIELRSIV